MPRRFASPAPARYKPPGRDSERAKAQATLLLTGAAHLRNLTPESLANTCNLKPETAARMFAAEQQRRERLL